MAYNLPKPFFVLAPMDDVTDTVFRQIISSCAPPDLCFTEFVNVDGLCSPGRARLLKKLEKKGDEPPLVAHLWGLNPDHFYTIAAEIASGKLADELKQQQFAGIDINMGCPARAVVRHGACSALINNRPLAKEIIEAVKSGSRGRLPVSVKSRLGFNSIDPAWTRFLLAQKLDLFSIHLRTVKEMSLVAAHYGELDRIKLERDELSPGTLLVANGDIADHRTGSELARRFKLDGVMIGRGVFNDPYAFAEATPWTKMPPKEKLLLFRRQLLTYQQWAERPDAGVGRMNKYAKIYINGFPGAKELREQLAISSNIDSLLEALDSFNSARV